MSDWLSKKNIDQKKQEFSQPARDWANAQLAWEQKVFSIYDAMIRSIIDDVRNAYVMG